MFVDWDHAADEQTAMLRAASMAYRDDERMVALLDELAGVPAFADRWTAQHLAENRRRSQQVRHPVHGILTIDVEVLLLSDDSSQRLVVWSPADEATAVAFAAAGTPDVASPARLRVVGNA